VNMRDGSRARAGRGQRASAGSPWRLVAVPAAIALGAVGAVAAERVGLPAAVGAGAGALAAVLSVLALPSIPTRRATILLLGVGGLGALRHAAFPGADSSFLLVVWAAGTLFALLLVDRADAESTPLLQGGAALSGRLREATRSAVVLGAIVAVATVALVPPITQRLGRHVWPGLVPTAGDSASAAPSLRSSNELDMRSRPRLSKKVVFTVDAPRADFWRGETFDRWDGQTWTRSTHAAEQLARAGDTTPLVLDPFDDSAHRGEPMRQTFRIEASFSDVVFAAPSPVSVETDKPLVGRPDGTACVGTIETCASRFSGSEDPSASLGHGAVYTVVSRSLLPTEDALRAAAGGPVPTSLLEQYTQVPASTTPRVRALATLITKDAPTTYDKIRAIETWLGAHTRYSINAPTSQGVADVVDDFLFHTRLGWCEQISSSMVVLARAVGIPARLATGFVPGDRDRLTGRFIVRERDAHAWAEVYFPGVGWQGFDPTASVPLAGEAHSSGSWLEAARRHALVFGILAVVAVVLAGAAPQLIARGRRRAARRHGRWATRTLDRIERAGRKAGRPRAPSETPREYASALVSVFEDGRLAAVGDALDTDAYGRAGANADARAAADAVLTSLSP